MIEANAVSSMEFFPDSSQYRETSIEVFKHYEHYISARESKKFN